MSTITKEFTKEQLQQIIETGHVQCGEASELARIALVSLELERGIIRRFDLDMSNCDSCGQDCGADMVEDLDGEYVLWDEVLPYLYRYGEYTIHQEQAVPDEMTPKQASRSYCGEVRGYRDGWNACRAAMLQGDEPVTDNTNQQFESLRRGDK